MKAIESQAASKPQAGVTDAGSGETIIFTNHVAQAVDEAVERMAPTSVFVIADVNRLVCASTPAERVKGDRWCEGDYDQGRGNVQEY